MKLLNRKKEIEEEENRTCETDVSDQSKWERKCKWMIRRRRRHNIDCVLLAFQSWFIEQGGEKLLDIVSKKKKN